MPYILQTTNYFETWVATQVTLYKTRLLFSARGYDMVVSIFSSPNLISKFPNRDLAWNPGVLQYEKGGSAGQKFW